MKTKPKPKRLKSRPEPAFPKSYCVLRGKELVGVYDWLADALEARGEGCQIFEKLTRQTGTLVHQHEELLGALKQVMPYVGSAGMAGVCFDLIGRCDEYLREVAEACKVAGA